MRRGRRVLRVAPVAVALLSLACARAVNYADPEQPRFAGQHAVPAAAVPGAAMAGAARPGVAMAGAAPSEAAAPRSAAPGAAASDADLRLVSFNIQFARHIDAAIALLAADPALRAPDVLALQEMDEAGVERIARALGLNYVYYPSAVHPVNDRNFGNAILSPWPILASRKLPLPHRSRTRGLERAAVVATVAVNGERVRIYSIHLETPFALGDRERRDQVRAILTDAATSPDPVLIAGDLNSHGLGEMFEAAGYTWPTSEVGPTVSFFSWDHVFARGFAPDRDAVAGTVADAGGASDHRPVWVALGPGGTRPARTSS